MAAVEHLNSQQFTSRTRAGGGASRRLSDSSVPTRGYMVGVQGHEATIPSGSFGVRDVTAHRQELLHSPERTSDSYQGSWVTMHGDQQHTVLDHSVRVANRNAAVTLGRAGNQESIYKLSSHYPEGGKEIPLMQPAQFPAKAF